MKVIKSVNIIGAGNVAFHLAKNLNKEIQIVNVYSRTFENALSLANEFGGNAIQDLSKIISADLTIISVVDDAIMDVISQLPSDLNVVHTSGSRGVEVLSKFSESGVFYPLQTFSKSKSVNISDVPFLLEASTSDFYASLEAFCNSNFSNNVQFADSEKRGVIHLSAVLTSNFLNHLIAESKELLESSNVDYKVLQPLLQETVRKAFENDPVLAQTGPAKRKDAGVLKKHEDMLSNEKLKKVYQLLSQLIIEKQD